MDTRTRLRRRLAAALFLTAAVCAAAPAEDALEILSNREGDRTGSVSINYRQARFDKVLEDLSKARPGVRLDVRAESFQEEQELRAMIVTLGPLSRVSWDTAIKYVADRLKLTVNNSQLPEGIVYLEKAARFTDTFDGMRLGEAVREICKRGNANVIFSPNVGTDAPVYLSFVDVPWREALESLLKAHSCAVLYDADGKIMRIATLSETNVILETRARQLRYIVPMGSHFKIDLLKDTVDDFVKRGDEGTKEMEDSKGSIMYALNEIRTKSSRENDSNAGRVTYEARTNTIIMCDTPTKIQEMLKIIDTVDTPVPQVLIEARLLNVEDTALKRIGMRWGNGQGGAVENSGITAGPTSGPQWDATWPLHPLLPAVGSKYGTMDMGSLRFLLQLAEGDDAIKITQAPQILTLDNEEASVFIGGVLTYAMVDSSQNETGVRFSIKREEMLTGVQLTVVPHVIRGTENIMVEIVPKEMDDVDLVEVQTLGGTTAIPGKRNVKVLHTKMMLRSTETGVIAGLLRDEVKESGTRVPGISKVPVLGKLFQHKSTRSIKSNTMILVTPTLVPENGDANFDQDIENYKNSIASSLR